MTIDVPIFAPYQMLVELTLNVALVIIVNIAVVQTHWLVILCTLANNHSYLARLILNACLDNRAMENLAMLLVVATLIVLITKDVMLDFARLFVTAILNAQLIRFVRIDFVILVVAMIILARIMRLASVINVEVS